MTRFRGFLLVAIVVAFCCSAHATSIQINNTGSGSATSITSLDAFDIPTSGAGGTGNARFRNDTGLVWTSLTITILATPRDEIEPLTDCTSDFFAACSYTTDGTTHTFAFSGGSGIGLGQEFQVAWNRWSGTSLSGDPYGEPEPLPEPGTMALFLAGVAAVGLRRRFQARRT
jgi:hypothetical protein